MYACERFHTKMAINFLQQKKKQKIVLVGFVLVVLVTSVVLWRGFFTTAQVPQILQSSGGQSFKRADIDFTLFTNPIFEKIPAPLPPAPFPENIGRANPFLPSLPAVLSPLKDLLPAISSETEI